MKVRIDFGEESKSPKVIHFWVDGSFDADLIYLKISHEYRRHCEITPDWFRIIIQCGSLVNSLPHLNHRLTQYEMIFKNLIDGSRCRPCLYLPLEPTYERLLVNLESEAFFSWSISDQILAMVDFHDSYLSDFDFLNHPMLLESDYAVRFYLPQALAWCRQYQ